MLLILRKSLFIIAAYLLTLSPISNASTPKDNPITLGIFPYISPGQMVKFHNDFKKILSEALERKVILVSAPSFKKFIQRTKQSQYDIIMTAPHLGRLAEVRDGYRPIVHTMHAIQGVYLVAKDSGIQRLEDLKGKTITMVGRKALVTQMAEKQLASLGLKNGENISLRFTKTHNNAMYAPLRGESEASVPGILLWQKIGQKERERIRAIGKTPAAPGFLVMASSNVPESDFHVIQRALLDVHHTPHGKQYLEKTGFNRFDILDDKEKKELDPFIANHLKKKKQP